MKGPIIRKISLLLGLILLLAPGPGSALGFVWCFGEDGHAALEYRLGDACRAESKEAARQPDSAPGVTAQDDHCGPCLDVPPSFEAASGRLRVHQGQALQLPPAALQSHLAAPGFPRTITANLYPQPPPRTSQAILSHRTVVLLN